MLKKKTKDFDMALIDIGSCGLHVVHGAFKDGAAASTWNVDEFMKSLHWLFKDTPVRREDYCRAVKNDNPPFPFKFCPTRWIKNVPFVERAIAIHPQVKMYIAAVEAKAPGIVNPKTKSYEIVKKGINDILLPAKMAVYQSVANELMHSLCFTRPISL